MNLKFIQKIFISLLIINSIFSENKTPLQSLNLDPNVFNLQSIKFDKVSPYPIQQEYLFKELSNSPNDYGSFLINLKSFVDTFSSKETIENTSSLIYQVFNKIPKQFNQDVVDLTKAYYFLRFPNRFSDKKEIDALVQRAKNKKMSAYNSLLAALLLEKHLNPKRPDLKIKRDFESLLLKSVHDKNADAMFFYALGNFYLNFFKRQNSLTKLRLITLNFEKSRARDHRNRNLFVSITSKYIQLHDYYSQNNINMPFAFEELVFRRVILLDPKNPMAHNNLADLYSNQNVQLKEALKEAKIATSLDPSNPYIMDTLGYCLYKNKKYQDSVETFLKAIKIDDNQAIIYFHLASSYYDLKKYQLAIKNFKKSIDLDPRNSLTLNNLAYLYSELNQNLDEALIMCKLALKAAPKNPAYLDTLGWIYYQTGRYKEAKDILEKVLIIDPESKESQAHLSEILLKLNPNYKKEIHKQTIHHKHTPLKSSSKDAYNLLYQSIINAKNIFIKNNKKGVKKSDLKIFYDQLISLSSSQGDYAKLSLFMKEFENLRIDSNQLQNTSSIKPQVHPLDDFFNFFPKKPQLFIHAKHKALIKLYSKIFSYFTKSMPINEQIQKKIIKELPKQMAISLFKPNKNTKLQIFACSKLNKNKIQFIHRNLELFTGRPIQIPGFKDTQTKIQSINLNTYQLQIFDVNIFIYIKDNYLIVSNSLLATRNLPHKTKNSLRSNAQFLSYIKSANNFSYEIQLFSDDFSSLNTQLDKSTLDVIKQITPEFDVLDKIKSYMVFLNVVNDTVYELEFIKAKKELQIKQIIKSIEIASKQFEKSLEKDKDYQIESEILVQNGIIKIKTKMNYFSSFIESIINKFQLDPQHLKDIYKLKKDNNND